MVVLSLGVGRLYFDDSARLCSKTQAWKNVILPLYSGKLHKLHCYYGHFVKILIFSQVYNVLLGYTRSFTFFIQKETFWGSYVMCKSLFIILNSKTLLSSERKCFRRESFFFWVLLKLARKVAKWIGLEYEK